MYLLYKIDCIQLSLYNINALEITANRLYKVSNHQLYYCHKMLRIAEKV